MASTSAAMDEMQTAVHMAAANGQVKNEINYSDTDEGEL